MQSIEDDAQLQSHLNQDPDQKTKYLRKKFQANKFLCTEIFFEGNEPIIKDKTFLSQIRKDSNFLIPKTMAKLMGGI